MSDIRDSRLTEMTERAPWPGVHKIKKSGEAGRPTLQRKILSLDFLLVLALIPGATKGQLTYPGKVTVPCRVLSECLREQS